MISEEQYGPIVILAGLVAMFVAIGAILYVGVIVMQAESSNLTFTTPNGTMLTWGEYCDWIYFGDNNSEGYVLEKIQNCKQ
jgi:hypothetical protein